MRSSFANITARLIRVKDREIIAHLTSFGLTARNDFITGGREALQRAAEDLAMQVNKSLVVKEGQ